MKIVSEAAENITPLPVKSLKDRFLSMPRGRPVEVDMTRFPDAPQEIFVRPPSGKDVAAWEQSGIEYGKRGQVKVKTCPTRKAELLQMTLCDADGALIFAKSEINQIATLDASIVNYLFKAAKKVSGQEVMEDDDDDEDAEGN